MNPICAQSLLSSASNFFRISLSLSHRRAGSNPQSPVSITPLQPNIKIPRSDIQRCFDLSSSPAHQLKGAAFFSSPHWKTKKPSSGGVKMAALAANPYILCRENPFREQGIHASNGGGCSLVAVNGGVFPVFSGARGGRRRPRGEVKAGFFWEHSASRPTSIEMQAIAGVEELDEILRRSQERSQPIVIDWMAAWCRKCIYLKPKLEKLAAEYHPRVKFYYVDVNKVSQELVKRGNISKMPTIQLWKDGEMKAEVIGGHKAWLVMDEVREMIQNNI